MEDELQKLIEDEANDFFKNQIINPVLREYFTYYDEQCYKVFSKELAEILEEHLPEHFSIDYHNKIGQYFFSSLFGYPLEESKLIEIIKSEDINTKEFNGLQVTFLDGIDILKIVASESVQNMTVKFDLTKDLIIAIILKYLNKYHE